MPAKFLTITQRGFDFIVHDSSDKTIPDEKWSIERVAAFMSVHAALNMMATKYSKGRTFRTLIASIQYTLHCDRPSSADLEKLTSFLTAKMCAFYSDPTKQGFLGRALKDVLDDVQEIAEAHIRGEEAPVMVFGQEVQPKPFFSRPSKEEYDEELRLQEEKSKLMWDHFKDVLNSGSAAGHRISIREGSNVYSATITKVSDKSVYCDIKDEYGRLLQKGTRLPKNSPRFIIESFI